MKPNNAIEVTDVTKSFKVYFDKGNTMKEKVLFQKRRRYEERRVLDGICFEVKKGEAIGLIGHNGCGKSTIRLGRSNKRLSNTPQASDRLQRILITTCNIPQFESDILQRVYGLSIS